MTIRLTWARAVAALTAMVAAGMVFAWSGVFNVGASSGHWAVTDWFLHWTMRNSVKTHAALTTPSQVSDPTGVVSAAGHFAQACASCHGAPGMRRLPVMQGATPHAPDLAINARAWTDRQLYWILEHGVKFSGMPSWAAKDRPDEVRRMVAFVRLLPEMTPQAYRTLVDGPDARVAGLRPGVVARCTGCHGADGRGRGAPDIPVLGGQRPEYLLAALRAYASNRRSSAVMRQAAATLTIGEMQALARHFAAMPGLPRTRTDARVEAKAREIALHGLKTEQLPACVSCHDPGRRNAYPVIHGQRATYIAERLRRWRGDEAEIDARKPHATMPVIARRIPEEMIEPLARYFTESR